jgi:Zn-dependent protease
VGLLIALFVGILNIVAFQAFINANLGMAVSMSWLFTFLATFARCSINIALFNMIPVPPLDASKLLQAALSPNAAVKFAQNEKLLQLVLIMLVVLGIVSAIIYPITEQLVNIAWYW